MVSDNDCDVAVCDIKGVGIFPHQAILCVLRIYKIYACISTQNCIFFFPFPADFVLSIPTFILLWNNNRRMNIAISYK